MAKQKKCDEISLGSPLYKAMTRLPDEASGIKKSLIWLCSYIDRDIRLRFGKKIGKEEIDEEYLEKLRQGYPKLSAFTAEDFKKLFDAYLDIRNVAAHISNTRKIQIDEGLLNSLYKIAQPINNVTSEQGATIYGLCYILSFLSIRAALWPFSTSLITRYFLKDGMGKNELVLMLNNDLMSHASNNGTIYPPLIEKEETLPKIEYAFLQPLLFDNLTDIFFAIERTAAKRTETPRFALNNFRNLMNEFGKKVYPEKIVEEIIKLRNLWLHGYWLYDVSIDGGTTDDLSAFCDPLFDMVAEHPNDEYRKLRDQIDQYVTNFGTDLVDFVARRLYEVSYKIMDTRLFDENKIAERVSNGLFAWTRIKSLQQFDLLYWGTSLERQDHTFSIVRSKFIDRMERMTTVDEIIIYEIKSSENITIGGVDSQSKEMVLSNINLPKEYQNLINGKRLDELSFVDTDEHYDRIIVKRAII